MNKLKILDLFSGLGGFSLGLERTGHFKTVAFCDNDKFSNLVLQKHWKGVKIYNNVKEITKERLEADGIESPDIITGGFPCQPFSVAGKQKGTSDDRHLWPEMFRIIKAFKPRFVIGENVRGIINIQDGVVFEAVCTDLESEGYEVQPFIIPAAGVGAPHRRERVWIIAIREESMVNSNNIRFEQHIETEEEASRRRSSATFEPTSTTNVADTESKNIHQQSRENYSTGKIVEGWKTKIRSELGRRSENVADTEIMRFRGRSGEERGAEERKFQQSEQKGSSFRSEAERRSSQNREDVADTRSERLEGQFGSKLQGIREGFTNSSEGSREDASHTNRTGSQRLGSEHELRNSEEEKQTRRIGWWDVEPDVGRVAYGVSGRVHRLKGLGNAIVPQIAEEIGKAIINATSKN